MFRNERELPDGDRGVPTVFRNKGEVSDGDRNATKGVSVQDILK